MKSPYQDLILSIQKYKWYQAVPYHLCQGIFLKYGWSLPRSKFKSLLKYIFWLETFPIFLMQAYLVFQDHFQPFHESLKTRSYFMHFFSENHLLLTCYEKAYLHVKRRKSNLAWIRWCVVHWWPVCCYPLWYNCENKQTNKKWNILLNYHFLRFLQFFTWTFTILKTEKVFQMHVQSVKNNKWRTLTF